MRDKRLDNRPTERAEMLLIRIGHHLWREHLKARKAKNGPLADEYLKCCQIVWNAKEALRVDLREKWLESCKKRAATLSLARSAKARR